MNWKMTAKTILMQLHHKVKTFENIQKRLVLVIQDQFFKYLEREFQFNHVNHVRLGDSMQFHIYKLTQIEKSDFRMELTSRLSTDSQGIAKSLGLQTDPKIELETIVKTIEGKITENTVFTLV